MGAKHFRDEPAEPALRKAPAAELFPGGKDGCPLLLVPRHSANPMSSRTLLGGGVLLLMFGALCLAWLAFFRSATPDAAASHKQETPRQSVSAMHPGDARPGHSSAPHVSGQWIGELERIWGISGHPGELHFLVKLDTPGGQSGSIEVVTLDHQFADEVLDYQTATERAELADSPRSGAAGDRVSITGELDLSREVMYRIAPATTPLVRLKRIERVGEPNSRAVVGGPKRDASSFLQKSEAWPLIEILRVHPATSGRSLRLAGRFQGWIRDSETVLISLGVDGRAAEVQFPKCDFAQYHKGDRVEAEATTTDRVSQRVVGNTLHVRPYLQGASIRRPEIAGDRLIAGAAPNLTEPLLAAVREPVGPDPVNLVSPAARPQTPIARSDEATNRGSEILVVSEDGQATLLVEGRWQTLRLPTPFPKAIKCAYVDRHGFCWLGGEGGMLILDGKSLRTCSADEGFPRETISWILEDRRSRMWVASWGDGIACLESNEWRHREPGTADSDRWRKYTRQEGLCRDDINCLAEDQQGRLWIGSNAFGASGGVAPGGGISILKDGTFVNGLLPESMARLQVMSMEHDIQGRIYIGFIGGLIMLDQDLKARVVTAQEGLPQRTPQATFLDSRGRLWAGTWGGGVVQIDQTSGRASEQLALREAHQIRRICEDATGTIWVASLEGLWKLEANTWGRVSLPAGISAVCVVAAIPKPIARQLAPFFGTPTLAGRSAPPTDAETARNSAPENQQVIPENHPVINDLKKRRLLGPWYAIALKTAANVSSEDLLTSGNYSAKYAKAEGIVEAARVISEFNATVRNGIAKTDIVVRSFPTEKEAEKAIANMQRSAVRDGFR